MGIEPGQELGFRTYPGPGTGDLVIDTPDGRRIVTERGDGYERLYAEINVTGARCIDENSWKQFSPVC